MKNFDPEKISEFLKSPKSKPVLFFGFYFIFFLVLALLFRMTPATPKNQVPQARPKHYYNLGKLEDGNFHFDYKYNINNIMYTYTGDQNGVRQIFSRSSNNVVEDYYGYTNLFMQKQNGVWNKCNNPYVFYEFLDVNNIKKILSKATFMSKTEFQDESKSYTYQISTSTLEKIISNNIVDLDDVPNQIVITMDENSYVEKIDYSLNSYALYKNPNLKNVNISLSYSDFGNIKEIEEPK